ncbi:MAG: ABC transporter permease [Woeseiaceae bacterium]|nr:ABC transporter permease [Woeseiaceae bacterium]
MRILLDTNESFRIALSAIRTNKARGTLTTLGIIIGIVAVITTMTAFNGMRNAFSEGFSSIGSDVLYVSRMPWVVMNDFFLYRNRPRLELAEAEKLERNLEGRAIVNPTMDTSRSIQYNAARMDGVRIIGTTEKQAVISSVVPQTGRYLMASDVRLRKPVAVIGVDIRDTLFSGANPINKKIRIGSYSYKVVGVMEKQGGATFGGPNFDRQIYISITSFVKSFGGSRGTDVDIAVKAPSHDAMEDLEYEVIGEMRKIRQLRPSEDDNFTVNKLDTLMGAFNQTMGIMILLGLIVTSIALFVGGIGVMNIMFVSVTERTREIGIRKAIGARNISILLQFLFESAIICLAGGVIGIVLATILTSVINANVMPASISLPILAIAILLSVAVGVLAGFVPAYKGARLNPIDALRYE